MSNLVVSECFGPTIQGEGALIGKPTVFVRTGGCDYQHCSWCDTLYAVLPKHKAEWKVMATEEVFAQIQQLSSNKPLLVTLSGGNPAIQPLEALLDLGHLANYKFAIETQGSIAQSWFSKLDYVTLSPKPPSSKMITRWERLDRCVNFCKSVETFIKVVIFDEVDYSYAKEVANRYPMLPLYLQVGNHTPPHRSQEIDVEGVFSRLNWLVNRVMEDKWHSVTILPQLHTLLWGNKRCV